MGRNNFLFFYWLSTIIVVLLEKRITRIYTSTDSIQKEIFTHHQRVAAKTTLSSWRCKELKIEFISPPFVGHEHENKYFPFSPSTNKKQGTSRKTEPDREKDCQKQAVL